jgi:L-ribulose-5-phosphate 3-epimerase
MRLGAITDEFSPDPEIAAAAMRAAGLETAELRVLWGRNILDLNDIELDRALAIFSKQGLAIDSIASPLFKCVLPGDAPLDRRFERDVFNAAYDFADQARLTNRAFDIAHRCGAGIVRVFSFWRTAQPETVFERVVDLLMDLAEQASDADLTIGLENEHACNIATTREAARVLAALDHPNLKIVWDPANALVAGESPESGGLDLLPVGRMCMPKIAASWMGSRSGWLSGRVTSDGASRFRRCVRRDMPATSTWKRTGPDRTATNWKRAASARSSCAKP